MPPRDVLFGKERVFGSLRGIRIDNDFEAEAPQVRTAPRRRRRACSGADARHRGRTQVSASARVERVSAAPKHRVEPAELEFDAGGRPYSSRYGDVYASRDGALGQARHVFLGGNDLPRRWARREQFVVLETASGWASTSSPPAGWRDDRDRRAGCTSSRSSGTRWRPPISSVRRRRRCSRWRRSLPRSGRRRWPACTGWHSRTAPWC